MTEFYKNPNTKHSIEKKGGPFYASFISFRYEAIEIFLCHTEDLFMGNISSKFPFFSKNINV